MVNVALLNPLHARVVARAGQRYKHSISSACVVLWATLHCLTISTTDLTCPYIYFVSFLCLDGTSGPRSPV